MQTTNSLILVHQGDDAAVASSELKAGSSFPVDGKTILLLDDIPFGHKVALRDIRVGENIMKYGNPIGRAKRDIRIGQHIHTHNMETNLDGLLDYSYMPEEYIKPEFREATFQGYRRTDGKVGVRNELWIVPTVGCVNTTARILEQQAKSKWGDKVDDIWACTHSMGCSQLGDDQETTRKLLAGIIRNPNAGGVLVLSLGCENSNLDVFLPYLGDFDKNRVKFLVTQQVEDEYASGMSLLEELAEYASTFERETVSAGELVVGFKCGGSDAFSGLTANPLSGKLNDILVSCGGSTILTEVPEMFGAETLLMARAASQDVFDRIVQMINDYKSYFMRYGQKIYENPSPGNKKGGITTLEEKSLGCTQKGGRAPVEGVLGYGEQITQKGLHLLVGPGNDQVSCTSLVASGATIICFTTGLGTPFGAPVPTVKISSNSPLAEHKRSWIDFDAGVLLEGKSMEELSSSLFQYILRVADGQQKTCNETMRYKEVALFKDGVIQ